MKMMMVMSEDTDSVSQPGVRERLLAAALRLFSENGYDGTSTREIVSAANANQGHIPYYFGTKEALWKEAVGGAFDKLQAHMESVAGIPGADGRERLALLIRRYVHFVAAHPEFIRLMNEEGKRDGERMRWLVDTHVRGVFAGMSAIYETAVAEGALTTPVPAAHFHYIFAGAVAMFFHQRPECLRLFGMDPMAEDAVDIHADALVQLFLGEADIGKAAWANQKPALQPS